MSATKSEKRSWEQYFFLRFYYGFGIFLRYFAARHSKGDRGFFCVIFNMSLVSDMQQTLILFNDDFVDDGFSCVVAASKVVLTSLDDAVTANKEYPPDSIQCQPDHYRAQHTHFQGPFRHLFSFFSLTFHSVKKQPEVIRRLDEQPFTLVIAEYHSNTEVFLIPESEARLVTWKTWFVEAVALDSQHNSDHEYSDEHERKEDEVSEELQTLFLAHPPLLRSFLLKDIDIYAHQLAVHAHVTDVFILHP